MKIVVSRCDLLGFGFRLIRSEILVKIMPDLENYSDSLYEKYPDNPECRRKVDRMTNHLIDALNKSARARFSNYSKIGRMMAQPNQFGDCLGGPPPHALVSGLIIKKYGRVRQWKELMDDIRGF